MKTLHSLELFRGLFAVMIVMSHNTTFYFDIYNEMPFGAKSSAGRVEFFFVLSGFIMLTIHRFEIGLASKLKHFALKRVARIYPFYILVLLLMYSSPDLLLHFKSDYPTWKTVIKDLTLLVNYDRTMGVVWTLEHEIVFYFMFATLLLNKHLGVTVLATWFVAIIYVNFVIDSTFATSFFLSTYNLGFFIGLAVAQLLYVNKEFLSARLLLVFGVLSYIVVSVIDINGFYDLSQQTRRFMFEGAGAAIIIGGVYTERRMGFTRFWIAKAVGKASFSIYLTHLIFNVLIYNVMKEIGVLQYMNCFVSASICVATSVVGGCILSKYIEVPLCTYVRKKLLAY